MSNLHTLQILQKNTLSSLQSLIDFTNATLAAPPTPAPVAPTLVAPAPTLPEDAITLQDLESFFRYIHTTESNAYKNMYGWLMRMYGTTYPASKLLTLFEKISGKNNTLLIDQTYVSESKNDGITHIPSLTLEEDDVEIEVPKYSQPVMPGTDNDDEEDDDTPIQDTYDWYNGVVLTKEQKIYRQLLFTQNWKELAKRYMRALKNVFEPYFAVVNDDVTIVKTHQEYKILVQLAIENRNKIGNVLLPDTLMLWDKLPPVFLDECKNVFRSEMLFQPATLKQSIFSDILKIYRYFSNLQGHQSWKSKFSLIKDSPVDIQDLITNWLQEGKVTEEQRDYVITAITFANFCKSHDNENSSANYIGSNQFSQNFFVALEKTKGLPNGFMNWITNGITYKHFKKVLTEMGIQQVRRAEGQRYQGIRLLSYTTEDNTSYDDVNGYKIIKISDRDPRVMEKVFGTSYKQEEIQPYSPGDGIASFEDDQDLDLMKKNKVSDISRGSMLSSPAFSYDLEQEHLFYKSFKVNNSKVNIENALEQRKLTSLNDSRDTKSAVERARMEDEVTTSLIHEFMNNGSDECKNIRTDNNSIKKWLLQ